GVCLILIYTVIFVRGIGIALRARQKFFSLIALGCSVFIGFQVFVIIGGNINLIPITGVTLPFISYGGTSLLSSLCIVGVLQGVEWVNRTQMALDARMAYCRED
ncbi:MAG: FtsW/RodA/SpoVE family cell cycle protein, partial [Christensenellales bacterium]